MDRTSRRFRAAILAGVAAVAIAGAVYGIGGGPGNDAGGCAGAVAAAANLRDLATGDMAAFRVVDQPFDASALAFADEAGKPVTLADWHGRTVLLNLWATWCAPCRAEMPALDALQRQKGGEKFEIVAVSVDLGDDGKPRKFYQDVGIRSLAFRHDGKMAVFNELKKNGLAFGLPASLLVDPQGCVLGVLNAPAEWSGADAGALVDAALALAKP